MFADFDFDVIIRSLPYLFYDGMTFTIMLTALATTGGIIFGTALALMRLSGIAPLSVPAAGSIDSAGVFSNMRAPSRSAAAASPSA